jgi:hypothetical protein
MKPLRFVLLLVALSSLIACRSRVIQVTLVNTSRQPVSTIIVDYPGATFGVNSLAPGKTYLYSIKPLQTGPLKIQYTDAHGAIHSYLGLPLHKNQEGSIEIGLSQESATVRPVLR